MASCPQPRNWLGEEGGKNDEMPILVWKEPREKGKKAEDKGGRKDSGGVSTKKILEVKEGIWESGVRKDASAKVSWLGIEPQTFSSIYRTPKQLNGL